MKLTTKFILYLTLFFSGIVLLFGIRSMVRNSFAFEATRAQAASTSHSNSSHAKSK
ncbi:L,D-transpeptidase, partial [Collinsella aerofaciens]|nr:L,D-transpeptidase [Collinsella aerofaciens]